MTVVCPVVNCSFNDNKLCRKKTLVLCGNGGCSEVYDRRGGMYMDLRWTQPVGDEFKDMFEVAEGQVREAKTQVSEVSNQASAQVNEQASAELTTQVKDASDQASANVNNNSNDK